MCIYCNIPLFKNKKCVYCIAVLFRNFKTNKMNDICDLYLRYLGKCNLYGEVMEFRKQEQHSTNFEEIINWLQDLIKLSESPEQSQVTAKMFIKVTKQR